MVDARIVLIAGLVALCSAGASVSAEKLPKGQGPLTQVQTGAKVEVSGTLATSQLTKLEPTCWRDGEEFNTTPHPTDPRKFYCGSHVEWFEMTSETNEYVRRCGKWYKNRRSNKYYQAGSWIKEVVKKHPTNPTLYRRACAWIPRPWKGKVKQYYRAPSGVWYKSRESMEYYAAGKWGHFEVSRPHPTNPKLKLVAGHWVKNHHLKNSDKWRKLCGKWWLRGPGAGIRSFTYYTKGKWVVLKDFNKRRNDPMYRWDKKTCKFKKRKETAKTRRYYRRGVSLYKRGGLASGGYWFRSKYSRWYYKDQKWWHASKHVNDPRWRRNDKTGKWVRLNLAAHPELAKIVKDSKGVWYRDSTRAQRWSFGHWVPTGRPGLRQGAKPPKPLNLQAEVRGITNREFAKFLNWFLAKKVEVMPDAPISKQPWRAPPSPPQVPRGYSLPYVLPNDRLQAPRRSRAARRISRRRAEGRSRYSVEDGVSSLRGKFNVEPAKGTTLWKSIKKIATEVEDGEIKDYGAPETLSPGVPPSPDTQGPV